MSCTSAIISNALKGRSATTDQLCDLSLNLDILVMILHSLRNKADVLSFMRTCHVMYSAGVPMLLSSVLLGRKDTDFSSFADFILSNPEPRSRMLRELEIRPIWNSTVQSGMNKFIRALMQATNLEKFTMICGKGGNTLERLVIAILSGNESIQYLKLRGADEYTANALRKWKAPVKEANISTGRTAFLLRLHVTRMCAAFTSTLQTMKLRSPELISAALAFPAMLELVFEAAPYDLSTDGVMHAFPNLQRLSAWPSERNWSRQSVAEQRQLNVAKNRNSPWRQLDYVEGDVELIYIFTLPCKIIHLGIEITQYTHAPDTCLAAALSAASPSQLDLRFRLNDEDDLDLTRIRTCLRVAQSYITRLEIEYAVSEVDTKLTVSQLFDHIIYSLPALTALEGFDLVITYRSRGHLRPLVQGNASSFASMLDSFLHIVAQTYLRQLDLESLGVGLLQLVRTLTRLSLRVTGNGSYKWEVPKNEQGERLLVSTRHSKKTLIHEVLFSHLAAA